MHRAINSPSRPGNLPQRLNTSQVNNRYTSFSGVNNTNIRVSSQTPRSAIPSHRPLHSHSIDKLASIHQNNVRKSRMLPIRKVMCATHAPHRTFSVIKKTINDGELYSRESTKVLNTIADRLERPDIDLAHEVDVDYSGDVLNIETGKGTWVLNKHNVTKQIWLSSPLSGPSKYNYFPPSFHLDPNPNKIYSLDEGQGGEWKSERDAVTKLSTLLSNEFSTVFDIPIEFDHKF